jgi:hypothetical protein
VKKLEADGYRVAIDNRDFDASQTFLEEMEQCIKESRFTLAVISKVLDMAERKRRIIPLVIEPVEMPAWLYNIVGVDFTDADPIVDPYERIKQALGDPTSQESPRERGGSETSAKNDKPRIAPSKLPRTGDVLIGREDELAILDAAWDNPQTCIVQIVAPGGVGKTQLVKKWQERLLDNDRSRIRENSGEKNADDSHVVKRPSDRSTQSTAGLKIQPDGRPAVADVTGSGDPTTTASYSARAFDWSFYSQGTQQQASADDFFDRALRWFGETEPENYKDPWAKGERLAELVRQQPTLLILDGMEPLQHPPGPMAGELTDPSIKALLQGLQRDNPGLCIVTTREAVPTLDEMSEPKRVTVDLDSLSPQAGAELLTHYGVTGEPDELRQASINVDGHALALILLGTYLQARCNGDVRRRSEALLFSGHERYAAHAHKVMASYEAWFEQQDDTGRAAVVILRLMGLFNRPADAGCLAALRAEPTIPSLTEALFVGGNDEMRDELWQRAIERLRAARLLADDEGGIGTLDAHRSVREHFSIQLNVQPEAGREAHRRLYEHLKSVPKHELPDNLNDMMPLYHASMHATLAHVDTRKWAAAIGVQVADNWLDSLSETGDLVENIMAACMKTDLTTKLLDFLQGKDAPLSGFAKELEKFANLLSSLRGQMPTEEHRETIQGWRTQMTEMKQMCETFLNFS